MLVLRVSLYQFALCNSRTINFRCYWHGEELRIHRLEESFWSSGNDELTTFYKEPFGQSDLIVMLPDWYKQKKYNIEMAMVLNNDPILAGIPVFIIGYSPNFAEEYKNYRMAPQENLFLQELTKMGRFVCKFHDVFNSHNSLKEDSEYIKEVKESLKANSDEDHLLHFFWTPVDDIKDEILLQIIHHVLTIELQRMLNVHKCYGGTIDGWFSDRTKQAVRRFQKLHDLPAEGILNRETWKILRQEA